MLVFAVIERVLVVSNTCNNKIIRNNKRVFALCVCARIASLPNNRRRLSHCENSSNNPIPRLYRKFLHRFSATNLLWHPSSVTHQAKKTMIKKKKKNNNNNSANQKTTSKRNCDKSSKKKTTSKQRKRILRRNHLHWLPLCHPEMSPIWLRTNPASKKMTTTTKRGVSRLQHDDVIRTKERKHPLTPILLPRRTITPPSQHRAASTRAKTRATVTVIESPRTSHDPPLQVIKNSWPWKLAFLSSNNKTTTNPSSSNNNDNNRSHPNNTGSKKWNGQWRVVIGWVGSLVTW